jgi:hypothetical protein
MTIYYNGKLKKSVYGNVIADASNSFSMRTGMLNAADVMK